jgi:hypothetical protein
MEKEDPQKLQLPEFKKWRRRVGWTAFTITVGLVMTSLAVQGLAATGVVAKENVITHWLALLFPGVLVVTMYLAARNTYIASTWFGERLDFIKQQLARLQAVLSKPGPPLAFEGLNLSARSVANGVPLEVFVHVGGGYLPSRYRDLEHFHPGWLMGTYVDLLAAEKTSARTAAGKLAAALGGAFATGILTYGRLLEFMQSSV